MFFSLARVLPPTRRLSPASARAIPTEVGLEHDELIGRSCEAEVRRDMGTKGNSEGERGQGGLVESIGGGGGNLIKGWWQRKPQGASRERNGAFHRPALLSSAPDFYNILTVMIEAEFEM